MELEILQLLSKQASTGEEICHALGVEPEAFQSTAYQLWKDELIQGKLSDGCCGAACGSTCVSAMKTNRVWQLSTKGWQFLQVEIPDSASSV
jgi:predicted transcriptional regulator